MDYVVLYICFLKVPVGAMTESFGGEYNYIWDRMLEDPHCCNAYSLAGSLEKEAPE